MRRYVPVLCGLALAGVILLAVAVEAVYCAPQLKKIRTRLGITMVLIPGGEFYMGSNSGRPDEKPVHKVKVSSFYMDIYPVTQASYQQLMGNNPARYKNPKAPVERVRWTDAIRYLNARSRAEGLEPCYDLKTGKCDFLANGYRLPTEAEWEYACRAGTRTKYFFGNVASKLGLYAWYKANSGGKVRPVGTKKPNAWGLYDMCGNVWEWCNDWYGRDYYKHSPSVNPRGPATGTKRVLRGGAYNSPASECTSSYRHSAPPGSADVCFQQPFGFRAVRRAG